MDLRRNSPFRSISRTLLPALVTSLLGLLAGARAEAQDDYRIKAVRPEVHLSAGGHGDLGAGFRVDIPIVPNGFLRNERDDLALSPGMDFQFFDFRRDHHRRRVRDKDRVDNFLMIPQLAVQWNIYFPERGWSIFPELGAAVVIGAWDGRDNVHGAWDGRDNVHVDPLAAFGARKHFNRRTALVMRAGWPTGLQIGLAF